MPPQLLLPLLLLMGSMRPVSCAGRTARCVVCSASMSSRHGRLLVTSTGRCSYWQVTGA